MELHENVEMEHNAAISTWGHDGWYMVFVGSVNLVGLVQHGGHYTTLRRRWVMQKNEGEIL